MYTNETINRLTKELEKEKTENERLKTELRRMSAEVERLKADPDGIVDDIVCKATKIVAAAMKSQQKEK